ncbi:Uncharacterized protein GBIM_17419, partial [Gryllus bimaculatus]
EAVLRLVEVNGAGGGGGGRLKDPAFDYYCSANDHWTTEEIDVFHQGLHMYEKDFYTIAQEIGTKSTKQCVRFYYMWKQ